MSVGHVLHVYGVVERLHPILQLGISQPSNEDLGGSSVAVTGPYPSKGCLPLKGYRVGRGAKPGESPIGVKVPFRSIDSGSLSRAACVGPMMTPLKHYK